MQNNRKTKKGCWIKHQYTKLNSVSLHMKKNQLKYN